MLFNTLLLNNYLVFEAFYLFTNDRQVIGHYNYILSREKFTNNCVLSEKVEGKMLHVV